MLFPTIDFAIFFVVVFTGNWLLRPRYEAWRLFMIAASFFFYGYWNWRYAFLLGGSVVVNWFLAARAYDAMTVEGQKTPRSRAIVAFAVVVNLAFLGYFKYTEFFIDSVVSTLNALPFAIDPPFIEILLPVGISFFTFQAMSYVIDAGRDEIEPLPLLDFALFLSFFCQLVAGPIVRATEFAPQLHEHPDPRRIQSAPAFKLIFLGLFKKVVISGFLAANIVDDVFANPELYDRGDLLFAIYGYAIQIYADFSGYTDIAIGCALLLGFRFPQNFDRPYTATSMQDFWRRWHMTLSRWLRDYLYIPLGGNRGAKGFVYRNLFLTMLLGGLWHGANWTFVVWGSIHGAALVLEREIKERWAERGAIGIPAPVVKVLQWFLTFNVVCLAWVFFRSQSLGEAFTILGRLVTAGGTAALVTGMVLLVVLGSIAVQFTPRRVGERVEVLYSRMGFGLQIVLVVIGLLMIDALGPEGIDPFIYFQF